MVRTVSASSGIEIGCRLAACKAELGHGNWLPWLDREFGWSDRTALNFMRVYEMVTKSEKFSDLSLPVSSLYLLAPLNSGRSPPSRHRVVVSTSIVGLLPRSHCVDWAPRLGINSVIKPARAILTAPAAIS
jgi:hypothetical protein